METKYYIYTAALMLLGLSACSEEDDLIAEADTVTDCFLPDADATDEESVLRREFYASEGSYVLFNDTLRHEELGIDYNGDMQYDTELLDISYTIGSSTVSSIVYTYGYLQTIEEKKSAVEFLKGYVLPHLSSSLRPFSWMLARSISYTSGTTATSVVAVSGERCVAIALGNNIASLSDEEYETLAGNVFASYLGDRFIDNEVALADFYAVVDGLHGTRFSTADNPTQSETINLQHCYEAGFVTQHYITYGSWSFRTVGTYPSQEEDINSYVELIFNNTLDEIKEQYADYPKVIERATLLSELIVDLGYVY